MAVLPEQGAPDALYVLDLSCWMHRFFHTIGGRCAHGLVEMVGRIIRDQEPAFMAVACDMRWPTFRHEIAPKIYKANREPPDPTLLERMRWAREMLVDVHGLKLYAKRGFEADDIIATLTRLGLENGMRVVIVGVDKDLMQLVDGERVVMWDGKNRVIGIEEVVERFGVRPDQMRDYLAIVGDTSDNVPGIHGAGPKAAKEILGEFGSLGQALECVRFPYDRPFFMRSPRYRELLVAERARAELSQKLVTLAANVPITFDRTELAVDHG